MIGEGMKVRFVPCFDIRRTDDMAEIRSKTVTGTISYINWEHKMFLVEYPSGGTTQRESFKFWQIGSEVQLCGRF